MAKNRVKLVSNFAAAKAAGDLATRELIRKATDAMQETAEQRLEKGAGSRGYNLPLQIEKELRDKDGKISYPHFYGRWFEYGTRHIPALPFMRPGHRAGRKVIKNEAPAVFIKWMTARAAVRRWG